MSIFDRKYGKSINPGGDQAHMFTCNLGTIAAGTAATIPLLRAHGDLYVFSIWYTDAVTVAADGTNYTTLAIADYAAGSSVASVCTGVTTFTGGGWTSLVPVSMGATIGYKVAAGDLLVLTKTETASGKAMTRGCVTITFK